MKWNKVTIIGKVNVGKSTILNRLVENKVAGVTPTPGTTTFAIVGKKVIHDVTIFFVDTPGILKARDEEEKIQMVISQEELIDTDLIYFVIDAHTGITKEDTKVIEQLAPYRDRIPIFLVINKIDGIPKEKLLPFIDEISKEFYWNEIIPISAKRGANIDELLKTTLKYLKPREGTPPPDLTYSKEIPVVNDIIREKALTLIKREPGRHLKVEVEEIDIGKGRVYVRSRIVVDKPSIKAMVVGKKGQMIKSIGTLARKELEEKFGKKVFLELSVVEE
ncbi:MAG: GTPase Era [Thermosulfidibacteraceae bacterium]|jgi:GTP-binding protein Era